MEATTSSSIQQHEMLPFPPSFVDRLTRWVQQLPVPYWLTYFVFFVVHTFINHVFGWVDGSAPAWKFDPIIPMFPLWLWGPLAIITYLDATAQDALAKFGPLLDASPEAMRQLKYEFTTMPARGVLINSCIWAGFYAVFTVLAYPTYVALGFRTLGIVHTIVDGLIVFSIGTAIFYHSIRQLRLVQRTVKLVKHFDLFRLEPVYAFSVLTARTGIAWVFLSVLTLLMSPLQVSSVRWLEIGPTVGVVVSLSAFALPLWIVHRRLAQEKSELLVEHGRRVKLTLERIHHSVDENNSDDGPQLNSVLEALNREGNILEKIRTWPWKTETLAGFLSAIVLPIALLLLQLAIQKWLKL